MYLYFTQVHLFGKTLYFYFTTFKAKIITFHFFTFTETLVPFLFLIKYQKVKVYRDYNQSAAAPSARLSAEVNNRCRPDCRIAKSRWSWKHKVVWSLREIINIICLFD